MARSHLLVALRLSLAHHPLCHHFSSDRFGPVCSGCALFVPAFATTMPIAVAALLAGADSTAMFLAGAVLGLPQLAGMRLRWGRPARAAVKLLGGVGVATANVGLVMLPVPLPVKLALLALELAAFAGILALRMRSILATCHACPWRRDWEACPGFVPGARREPPVHARLPDTQRAVLPPPPST